MSTMSLTPEAAAYLDALRAELADLQQDERDDLLADVEVSLVESSDEDGALEERFGPPARFAAELRAAAGLEAVAAPSPRTDGLLERAAVLLQRLRTDERALRVRAAAAELAPIWWLVRAYVVAAALIELAGVGAWSSTRPELPAFGGRGTSVLVMGALVAGSVALGMRGRHARGRPAWLVANLVLLALAVPALAHALEGSGSAPFVLAVPEPAPPGPAAGLNYNGAPVENIYAFDRNGKPLYDVRLYDQAGKPLNIGGAASADPNRRIVETARGTLQFNSFPIRYFNPGTRVVSKPTAAPRAHAPRIATPPLKTRP